MLPFTMFRGTTGDRDMTASPHPLLMGRRGLCAGILAAAFSLPLAACSPATSPAGSKAGSTSTAAGSATSSSQSNTKQPSFRNTDLGCGWEPTESFALDYAQNFTVDRYDGGYQLACISNGERFLVVPEGKDDPDGLAEDIALVRQPLTSVYLVSTGMICLLDEIGALDAVTVSSVTADDSPVEDLTQAIQAGSVAYGGKYSSPDFELVAERGCTLAIENTKINHAPDIKQKLQDLGVTVLTEQSSSEPEALGRLEWLKLMGVLFGRETEAETSFERIAERVEAVASQEPTGKTVAFFYINDDGAAVTRRSTDYFSQMIELGGGTLISFDPTEENDGSSSVQAVIDMEAFYAGAKDADVIIYNTTVDASVTSLDDLVAKNALLADFKAVQQGAVYACDEHMYQRMTDMDEILGDIRAALEGTGESAGFIWRLG
ncbi:ABC transporter substrate-binding protein [Collinsella sp. An2]|uniref:ABC transporter substrate-binding protein n=1 Tax=Collinsella sp. An2 TaxID=1965585 RepID=UPI000B3781DF|nr:ABC transporter substrate-binding protein [Collinsella sp. An2]OUP09173.1 hypothetical protein B5F33_05420 [Collinsella sp. An2]